MAPPASLKAESLTCFTNCQLCISGELVPQDLYFSPETGIITANYYYRTEGIERIDLGGAIVAPGFLDLQTNGMLGVHFTNLGRSDGNRTRADDESDLETVARREVQSGVTGWWATVPTVEAGRWKEVSDLDCFRLRRVHFRLVYLFQFPRNTISRRAILRITQLIVALAK